MFSLSLEMYQLRFFRLFFWIFTFFQSPEKEPQRPYDQNGGSIAPRSLIFDPFAKETVFQRTHILGHGAYFINWGGLLIGPPIRGQHNWIRPRRANFINSGGLLI